MWIQWNDGDWEDGRFAYETGKIVELPNDCGKRYVDAGRAKEVKSPMVVVGVKKKKRPSARKRIPLISDGKSGTSMDDLLNSNLDD